MVPTGFAEEVPICPVGLPALLTTRPLGPGHDRCAQGATLAPSWDTTCWHPEGQPSWPGMLRHPISKMVTGRNFLNGIKRHIQGVGKAICCTGNKADEPVSRVWSQGNLQDPKGEEEKAASVLIPCPG